jgi:Domain of unknown function DUF29
VLQQIQYDCDLSLWLEETIAQLKRGDLQNIDIEHLIEELEGLAGRDRRELKSRLQTLLEHLLKRMYVNLPNEFNGWQRTIREQRKELRLLLETSPSLKSILTESFGPIYQKALKDLKEDYASVAFPETWPYDRDVETILSNNFWD